MQWVFLISIALLLYTYLGYPALIALWAFLRPRPILQGAATQDLCVSILIAAYNDAPALSRKLENLLALATSEPIREIWIGLDGCSDDSAARLHALPQNSIVRVCDFAQRRGKSAVLNDLMTKATQPIFVMMDVRQRVEAGAISHLLQNFSDPSVGVVSGQLVYETAFGAAQKGAQSYWGYEKFIRQCESRIWAVPGATGALYAIRRELCEPIPEDTLVDDVLIPMRAILKGHRCLFEPSARVFDTPTAHFEQENVRKRRTLAGIWQLAAREPQFFAPWANPIAFQWTSHKFLRLLTPFFVILALIALIFMTFNGQKCAQWLLGAAGIALLTSFLAFLGGKSTKSRILGILGAFFGVNWALLQSAWDAAKGRYIARWTRSQRQE